MSPFWNMSLLACDGANPLGTTEIVLGLNGDDAYKN